MTPFFERRTKKDRRLKKNGKTVKEKDLRTGKDRRSGKDRRTNPNLKVESERRRLTDNIVKYLEREFER